MFFRQRFRRPPPRLPRKVSFLAAQGTQERRDGARKGWLSCGPLFEAPLREISRWPGS